MRGRKPLPTAGRLRGGNRSKRPTNEAREPQPPRLPPDVAPPAHMPPVAAAIWRDYAPDLAAAGVLTTLDALALEMLCHAVADVRAARAVLAAHGSVTYTTRTAAGAVIVRAHPEAAHLAEADRRLRGWAGELGLSPSARARLAAPEGFDRADPATYFAA